MQRTNSYYGNRSDQGWMFFFKRYEDLFVKIRRHDNEYWVSFHDDFLLINRLRPEMKTYKRYNTTQEAELMTYLTHLIKILSLAYVMCKRRGYKMRECIVYDQSQQSYIVEFHSITSHIKIEMQLNDDTENTAVVLKQYSKKRLDIERWPATEKDLPASFTDLKVFEEYVKTH